jgi:hypothetical protein
MSDAFTRQWLHPDLKIHDLQSGVVTSREEFFWMIDRWKIIMQDKYNVVPGQTCLLWFNRPDVYYCSALFAALELGLVLISDMPRVYSHDDLLNDKITVHGHIDLAIVSHDAKNAWDMIVYYKTCNNILFDLDFDTYIVQQDSLNDERKNRQIADSNLALWQVPTSGTTGTAKTHRRSHRYQLALVDRIIQHTGYTQGSGRALHICDLHEGLSLHHHFLAAFKACEHQYLLDNSQGTYLDNIISAIHKHRISHISLHSPELLVNWICKTPPVDWQIHVNTLFQIPKEIVPMVKQKQITSIVSHFGSVTLAGPILIKTVTPDTDVNSYDINEFVAIDDEFFEIDLRNNELWVQVPSMNIDWHTGNDWLKRQDNKYIFLGRTDVVRIKDTNVVLQTLDDLVTKYFGYQATISVDAEREKIYLALWNDFDTQPFVNELSIVYPQMQIDYVLRDQSKQRFWNGRKVDRGAIRDYCREKLLHSAVLITYNPNC